MKCQPSSSLHKYRPPQTHSCSGDHILIVSPTSSAARTWGFGGLHPWKTIEQSIKMSLRWLSGGHCRGGRLFGIQIQSQSVKSFHYHKNPYNYTRALFHYSIRVEPIPKTPNNTLHSSSSSLYHNIIKFIHP